VLARLALILCGFGLLLPAVALADEAPISSTPSTVRPFFVCPDGPCDLIIDPTPAQTPSGYELPMGGAPLEGDGELGGYDPQDLQSAYRIPTSGGSGQTVAVIDPFKERLAEEALPVYRKRYGLEPCPKSNGCLRQVNEQGEEREPPGPENYFGWTETSTDIEMVSAACPHCHILLVLAPTSSLSDLAHAVDTAARLGATEITNSYGYSERNQRQPEANCGPTHCQQFNPDYDHPGIPITASSGDGDYEVEFPASSPNVIAVGGTNLRKAHNARAWSEEAWGDEEGEGTGSGCSDLEPKPAWQTDSGCSTRTNNDVAAVAGTKTPVSVFLKESETVGVWSLASGTSVAAPLIAGILAHASAFSRSLGAEAFYEDPGALFDVTTGSNANHCEPGYLCHAGPGYDGPTGLGTPDGPPNVPWSCEPSNACPVGEEEPPLG
jgi:subtilase family serine protease